MGSSEAWLKQLRDELKAPEKEVGRGVIGEL